MQQLNGHQDDNWRFLQHSFGLSENQLNQLQRYASLLIEWNDKFNLTAILDVPKIIHYHFYDSMKIADFIDFSSVSTIADIGTGAGFPGLPLKILFPHLRVILIEVNSKKRLFLEHIVKEFSLIDVIVSGDDWRTFLRKTSYGIDYFFARASLQPEELMRIFKSSCGYHKAIIVYWASQHWQPSHHEQAFVKKEVGYTIDDVPRKYVFFQQQR